MLSKAKGFTLIELVVSVAIFAVISTAAYAFISMVLTAKERSDAVSVELAALQKTMLILQQDFEQIVDRGIRDQYGDRQQPIVSNDLSAIEFSRVGWTVPPFAKTKRSEVARVRYYQEEGQLWRAHWPYPDRAEGSEAVKTALLSEMDALEVRYLFFNDEKQAEWSREWPPLSVALGSPRLPRAIEMTFEHKRYGKIRRVFRVVSPFPSPVRVEEVDSDENSNADADIDNIDQEGDELEADVGTP